jgi:peptidoglycan hydrolase-like protein with peptidoglycan-binding domain
MRLGEKKEPLNPDILPPNFNIAAAEETSEQEAASLSPTLSSVEDQSSERQSSILDLHRAIGNYGIARALQTRAWQPLVGQAATGSTQTKQSQTGNASSVAMVAQSPAWNSRQLRLIQRQLRRLGLYRLGIDGIFGSGTESGLVEAFGGNEWRQLTPDDILGRLTAASAPAGGAGEHRLRYGEMFRDGILDFTLGIGFDETGAHQAQIDAITQALADRGFRNDRAAAIRIYRQAGRTLGASDFGVYLVRENALTYRPPAGAARQIHAVVRLVTSRDGSQGAQAASAFREGMAQSDVAMYAGHGRYGSGPDFDRNMSFELLDQHGVITQRVDNYEALEGILQREGARNGRSAWQQFLWRVRHHRINVIGSNAGNLYLNPANRHSGEFGANLMYWNLQHNRVSPVTGRRGSLDSDVQANPERSFRVWLFDGCRTQDYLTSIRGTPGVDTHSTDIFASRRTLYWHDYADTVASFLDSILNQQSAEQILRGMDAANTSSQSRGPGQAFRAEGVIDNPIDR